MADQPQTLVIGIGSGRCGTHSLARLLNEQHDASVTHEMRPLLPWAVLDGGDAIKARVRRIRGRQAALVGDVASFYLPYLEQLMALEPDVRIVCLKRPCDEVVESFCQWLDRTNILPINHWAAKPNVGWYHDPVWSTIFPKYESTDREEGIRRYYHEYYETAGRFATRYPRNVRVFEMHEALNAAEQQRELLAFVGIPDTLQRPRLSLWTNLSANQPQRQRERDAAPDDVPVPDADRCAVLVPYTAGIAPACERALRVLERRGYPVQRVRGFSAIDVGRSQLATDAMKNGFEETMWIDADVAFEPDSVERLRGHGLPITCGIYPKKGRRALACHVAPEVKSMTFGPGGGLQEILYAGAGFLHVRRQVYQDIQQHCRLPVCNEAFSQQVIPYFLPMISRLNDGHWYLAEDFAFCERARQAGYRIMADTTIRLWHVGQYNYGWEDAGRDPQRFANYEFRFE